MALFNLFMDSAVGSDLNSGTGGTNDYTGQGDFDGTSIFTPNDGSTPASFIAVNDWVSLYNTPGDVACRCLAQVTAVAAGVNGAVTVSTTAKYGTVPTSSAGAHNRALKHGGSWASLGVVVATGCMGAGTVPQSTQVNIKANAAAYANAATSRNLGILGTATTPMIWSGYKVSPGDQDANVLAVPLTDIPRISFTTGVFTVNANQVIRNLDIQSAVVAAGGAIAANSNFSTLANVRVTNTAVNANSRAFTSNGTLFFAVGCYFNATTTANAVVSCSQISATLVGCYVVGGLIGITTTSSFIMANTVIDSAGGDAFTSTASAYIVNLTVYNPLGHGVNFTTVGGSCLLCGCYFENVNQASKFAITNSSGTNTNQIHVVGCAYFNCTGTVNGMGDYPEFFSAGTLASAGLNAPGSQDFTPKAVLQNIGFPAHMPTFSPTSFPTPGALDAQSGGGAGGGMTLAGRGGGIAG